MTRITAEELKRARAVLGCSQSQLSAVMNTPKRTIQDWELGVSPTPGWLPVMMRLLIQEDRRVMAEIKAKIENRIGGKR